ncbi:MAG: aldo/keto reductase, partial [Isosphaeraceae bacterium]
RRSCDLGMKATPMATGGFEELALPVARRKGLGVIAMKVFGQDQIVNAAPIDQLLRYALSLPVSLTSLGMPKPEYIDRNVAVARSFTPMKDQERKKLSDGILAERKVAMANFLSDHADV